MLHYRDTKIMGSLRCTLCCGETFDTTEELSSHLKNIMSNITCSRCCVKFLTLEKLLDHYLIEECSDMRPFVVESFTPMESSQSKEMQSPKECMHAVVDSDGKEMEASSKHKIILVGNDGSNAELEEMKVDAELICVTADAAEGEKPLQPFETKSESASLTDEDQHEPKVSPVEVSSLSMPGEKNDSDKTDESDENMFLCSCGMKFSSIVDHLMNFHCDEEVLVKGSSIQLETLLNPTSPKEAEIADEVPKKIAKLESELQVVEEMDVQPTNIELEEPEVVVCDRDNQNGESNIPKSLPTPPLSSVQIDQLEGKVEECVDKDGRLYLRKFVRVEKFWSEKDEIKAAQMLSKVKKFESVRDVGVGSVSIKSKDEAIPEKVPGTPKKLYQCNKCMKTFQTIIHFRYHVCFLKVGPSTCSLCGQESASSKEARAHWRMHQRQRRVAATALWEMQAGEGMSTNGNVPDEDSVQLQCERCGEMYNKRDELVHVAMHDEEPPFECNKCSESFTSKERLTRHMKSHREQKTHVCLYCGKTFTDSNAFKLHVRSHTGEKPFECTYCGKMFSRPYERMKHERIHTGERPHVCEICGKTFRVSYCLTLHKRTHSGDRPYCCDTCGKRFKAHSAYKHHVQIHSDERNYKCPYCPKAFKTMVHLAGHKKTHTKPFSCTECNRRFASLYSVKAHMESHKTGDNRFRYRCFVCGASYARAFALQYHMQTHGPCDAPEDVAEVLEICEEVEPKKEQGMSDTDDTFIDKKNEDDQSECEVSL